MNNKAGEVRSMLLDSDVNDISAGDIKNASAVMEAIASDINSLMETKWDDLAKVATDNPVRLVGMTLLEIAVSTLIAARLPKELIEKAGGDMAKLYLDPSAMAQLYSVYDFKDELAAHLHDLMQSGTTKKPVN